MSKDEVAICAKCVHVIDDIEAIIPNWWQCGAKVVSEKMNFQTGEMEKKYAFCFDANKDGKCPDYEAKEESEVADEQ